MREYEELAEEFSKEYLETIRQTICNAYKEGFLRAREMAHDEIYDCDGMTDFMLDRLTALGDRELRE